MKQQPEYQLQKAFARWLELKHPDVLFFSDAAAHVAKTVNQQIRANVLSKAGEKQPDMFIAHPSNGKAGLFIEFKSVCPFKVDGVTLKKNAHNEAQLETIKRLRERGYNAAFAWSFDMAINITEIHLGNRPWQKM